MPFSLPNLAKILRDLIKDAIGSSEDKALEHMRKSSVHFEEASKAYKSGNPDRWKQGDKAVQKGEEERMEADKSFNRAKTMKEIWSLIDKAIKAAKKQSP